MNIGKVAQCCKLTRELKMQLVTISYIVDGNTAVKSGNTKSWYGCRARGTLFILMMSMSINTTTLENNLYYFVSLNSVSFHHTCDSVYLGYIIYRNWHMWVGRHIHYCL